MKRPLTIGLVALAFAAWVVWVRQSPAVELETAPPAAVTSASANSISANSAGAGSAAEAQVLPPVTARFATSSRNAEVPDFRRHIEPLFSRLGCNGRSCHGSFQGRGGFRLSLFGYDAETDHATLLGSSDGKVNLKHPTQSLILLKPTLAIDHEGGLRMKRGGWEYRMLLNWIEGGAKLTNSDTASYKSASDSAANSSSKSTAAKSAPKPLDVVRLEVTPAEIQFRKPGEAVQLRAVVHWTDGTAEDVTPICRYQSNDDALAKVDQNGLVTCLGKGDTQIVAFYDNGITPVPVFLPTSDLVGSRYPATPTYNKIDALVLRKLKKLGITQSPVCDDATFLRRASIDATGTLPSPAEIRAFLADKSPNKRQRKIDELLNRPAYCAWLATRLCDLTGDNGIKIIWIDAAVASRQWYEWFYDRLRRNEPYDKIVAELLLSTSHRASESYVQYCKRMASYRDPDRPRSFGSSDCLPFYWSRNNFRTSEDRAMGFCYQFLGVQMQCCQCHKHPFDRWTKKDFDDFSHFFDRVAYGVPKADRQENAAMRADIEAQVEKLEADSGALDDVVVSRKTDARILLKLAAAKDGNSVPSIRAEKTAADRKIRIATRLTSAAAKNVADSASGTKKTIKLTGSIQFDLQREIFQMASEGKVVPYPEVYVLPKDATAKRTVSLATTSASPKSKPAKPQTKAKVKANLASNKASAKASSSKIAAAKAAKLAAAMTPPTGSTARFLAGDTVDLNQYDDPRQALVDWLRQNPRQYFARAIVNRVWANYFNVGIIQPTDDLNKAHPPSNPELLDYLTDAFVKHGYDLKWLQHEIMNSRTYQLSWVPNNTNVLDERNFSHAIPRRMPAEIAYDALEMATAGTAELRSYTERPEERVIGLDDDLGSTVVKRRGAINRYALAVFGKPAREINSDCERSNQPSLLQTFFLENDQETLGLIDRASGWLAEVSAKYGRAINTPLDVPKSSVPAGAKVKSDRKSKSPATPRLSPANVDSLVEDVFLRTLSRLPQPSELARGRQAITSAKKPKDGLRDLLWALLNTKEFIINH